MLQSVFLSSVAVQVMPWEFEEILLTAHLLSIDKLQSIFCFDISSYFCA